MGEPTLIVRFSDVEAIEQALSEAHTALTSQVDSVRRDIADRVSGWQEDSASRAAQIGFDRELGGWVTELTAALDAVRAALATVRQDAHDAEVRNVAILD